MVCSGFPMEAALVSGLKARALWGVAEVMIVLGMKKSWVYARVGSNELPHLKLPGGRIRFDPAEIAAWIERQKSKPAKLFSLRKED